MTIGFLLSIRLLWHRLTQLVRPEPPSPYEQEFKQLNENVTPEFADDELSTPHLSRRSSVLFDLLTLFRRSSSTCRTVLLPEKQTIDDQDESEEEDPATQNLTREGILQAIRQKKEVINKLRCQPWSMRRKRRTLMVARRYLQRQEQRVSKWHLYKVAIIRQTHLYLRWMSNMKIYLIPWEAKIKGIESHYGSVVSSYFTFLRWILGVNITITVIMLLFVVIPEWLADSRMQLYDARYNATFHNKVMPEEVLARADELSMVWDFKGYFQYSLLFYGFYSSETYFGDTVQYSLPVAFFLTNLFVLGYSFIVILRKMASNARLSKVAGAGTEQYVFNWKAFTGWDYTVGNAETASNVVMANVNKFREVIAEYNVNIKKKFDWFRFLLRIIANLLIIAMLVGSVWAISAVSGISVKDSFVKRNAVSITVSFITLVYPNIFDLISKVERYHPRTSLRLQLGRVLFLYIVNYYTLIYSLMLMLNAKQAELQVRQDNIPYSERFQRSPSASVNLLPSISTPTHRLGRQSVFEIPSNLALFNITDDVIPSTSPPPARPWTTVLPNYGPFGVQNPKAIVTHKTDNNTSIGSIFASHPIGQVDWTKRKKNNGNIVRLNFTFPRQRLVPEPYSAWRHDDLCWETEIGQEITKLVTMDLVMTIASILVIDFFRGLWVRYCSDWWFWSLEETFPEYGEFKVAENVLHLVNNQGMIWLGLFFVPLLPAINNIKLIILMYIRGWAVMTCNVPARQIFRASRSSNFYLMLLLLMLFLCTLPVAYVIASKTPSKNCGPFGRQQAFYSVIVEVLERNLNRNFMDALKYMASPGIIIPTLLLLLLIIYFLFALVRGLREANSDLTSQLMRERTEEKKKIFELAGGGKRKRRSKPPEKSPKNSQNGARRSFAAKPHSLSFPTDIRSDRKSPSGRLNREMNFIPSLKSVNEEASSTEGEEDLVARNTVFEEINEERQSWKDTLFNCAGLCDGMRSREGYHPASREEDIETCSVPRTKSTEHETTVDDRISYSPVTESTSPTSSPPRLPVGGQLTDVECAPAARSDGESDTEWHYAPAKTATAAQAAPNVKTLPNGHNGFLPHVNQSSSYSNAMMFPILDSPDDVIIEQRRQYYDHSRKQKLQPSHEAIEEVQETYEQVKPPRYDVQPTVTHEQIEMSPLTEHRTTKVAFQQRESRIVDGRLTVPVEVESPKEDSDSDSSSRKFLLHFAEEEAHSASEASAGKATHVKKQPRKLSDISIAQLLKKNEAPFQGTSRKDTREDYQYIPHPVDDRFFAADESRPRVSHQTTEDHHHRARSTPDESGTEVYALQERCEPRQQPSVDLGSMGPHIPTSPPASPSGHKHTFV